MEALVIKLFTRAINKDYRVVRILMRAFLSLDNVDKLKLANEHSFDEKSHSIVDVVYVPKLPDVNLALKYVLQLRWKF